MYPTITTLASYYKATESPATYFMGWTEAEFRAWMILGRKTKGYRDALENLWIAMTEVDHRFEDMVMAELMST